MRESRSGLTIPRRAGRAQIEDLTAEAPIIRQCREALIEDCAEVWGEENPVEDVEPLDVIGAPRPRFDVARPEQFHRGKTSERAPIPILDQSLTKDLADSLNDKPLGFGCSRKRGCPLFEDVKKFVRKRPRALEEGAPPDPMKLENVRSGDGPCALVIESFFAASCCGLGLAETSQRSTCRSPTECLVAARTP
jgi:hypothetical protein